MKFTETLTQGHSAIEAAQDLDALNEVRIQYLSKKGLVAELMKAMKDLSPDERPAYGQKVNHIKQALEQALSAKQTQLEALQLEADMIQDAIDISMPGQSWSIGCQNPLVGIQRQIEDIFREMGYAVVEGDEVELDLYNFERANIPQDHPAREMQDTFYIDPNTLLRSHTTAVQTRALEENAPHVPIKLICPGKVYRRDEDDATHSHQFVQCEGLVVGKGVTLADLKGTLSLLAKRMFGESRTIRFRPSYFQFTEPSVEVDVSCPFCNGKGCSICKQTGYIEILGAGMVHPAVLKAAGYEDDTLSGFAFGIGVERIAMLKYGITDIRSFYTNDKRFIEQFKRFE